MQSVVAVESLPSPISQRLKRKASSSWNKRLRGVSNMDKLLAMLKEMGIPFAYDHFAEGESPEPPFICYLLPGVNHFAADGMAYFKINEVHIELVGGTESGSRTGAVRHFL